MSGERIPTVLLIAPERFNAILSAAEVASAIGRGLQSRGWACDLCAIGDQAGGAGSILDALDFDRRLRRARALVTGTGRLNRHSLAGGWLFEVATRARQSGVPCYAIVGEDALDAFDKRILDLDVVLEAARAGGLEQAGAALAALL